MPRHFGSRRVLSLLVTLPMLTLSACASTHLAEPAEDAGPQADGGALAPDAGPVGMDPDAGAWPDAGDGPDASPDGGSLPDAQVDAAVGCGALGCTPVDMTMGYNRGCVLREDHSVRCFGQAPTNGPLHGDGHDPVWTVEGLEGELFLEDGYEHRVCVSDGRTLVCRGSSIEDYGEPAPERVELPFLATAAVGGWSHRCLLSEHGEVYCQGSQRGGRTGLGRGPGFQSSLERVPGIPAMRELVATEHGTCARSVEGDVWCWGSFTQSWLGVSGPVRVFDSADVLGAGELHVCAARGAEVFCWGGDVCGAVGDPVPHPDHPGAFAPSPPTRIEGLPEDQDVVALEGGFRFGCALYADGALWCWGRGPGEPCPFELRSDRCERRPLPRRVDDSSAQLTQMHAGRYAVCAIDEGAGQVLCWGSGRQGALDGAECAFESPHAIDWMIPSAP